MSKNVQRWIEILKTYAAPFVVAVSLFSIFEPEISKLLGFSRRQPASVTAVQLASVAPGTQLVEQTEAQLMQSMTEDEITTKLKQNRHQWLLTRQPYSVSADAVESTEKRSRKKLPKRFENNPIFRLFEDLQNSTVSVNYEDTLACDATRLFYERQIQRNPLLKDQSAARPVPQGEFSQVCIAYSMKQYTVPKSNYAICERPAGNPQLPGQKPCVTPSLVNLTYNAFVDATKCLGIDPKELMPKVDFESGFLLNAYGTNKEAGIGQLNKPNMDLVNSQFEKYWKEVEQKAPQSSYCLRLLASKNFLVPADSSNDERCSVMAMPNNPVRNIFYLAVQHKQNLADVESLFEQFSIKSRLEEAGLKNPDMNFFKNMIATAADTMGLQMAIDLLDTYLNDRQQARLTLKVSDFDFHSNPQQADLDGEMRTEVEIARSYIMSSYISTRDTKADVALKVAKRRALPHEWATAHTKRFPVYATLRANNYNATKNSALEPFSVFGFPGYLTLLAERQQSIRTIFSNSDLNPDQCVQKDYLKYVQPN